VYFGIFGFLTTKDRKDTATMFYGHLTLNERGKIEILLEDHSLREIAKKLGRNVSTISRELRRNRTPRGYSDIRAQAKYVVRRKECRPAQKLSYQKLWKHILDKIPEGWTPETIAGRLPLDYPDDPSMRICHETIYRCIYTNSRLHFLIQYLPQSRPKRRMRGQGKTGRAIANPGRVDISERPGIIEERIRYGDLEGDLIVGAKQSGYIMTLVCRTSRLLIARKCEKKEAELVADAIIDSLQDMPTSWVTTLTFDNGTEFFAHQRMAAALNADIYFAQPYSSWQRGTNENTNGLIRRYLPKGTSFKSLTQKQLDIIVEQINNRPRKCLGYQTSNEIFLKQRYEHRVALSA